MRTLLICFAAATLAIGAKSLAGDLASPPLPHGKLQWTIQFWRATCETVEPESPLRCAPPQGSSEQRIEVNLELAGVKKPGQANESIQNFEIKQPGQRTLSGRLTAYSVYPHADSVFPPYVQVQLELVRPIRVRCMESVRWREAFEMSPLICGGFGADPNENIGATLTLLPNPSGESKP